MFLYNLKSVILLNNNTAAAFLTYWDNLTLYIYNLLQCFYNIFTKIKEWKRGLTDFVSITLYPGYLNIMKKGAELTCYYCKAHVLKLVIRGTQCNCYIIWEIWPKDLLIVYNLMFLDFLFLFWKWQTSISGSDKSSIFIDKVPFSLHPWIGLIDNNTTKKEQQLFLSVSIKKRPLKLVSSLPE